jgi:hypothetical protein
MSEKTVTAEQVREWLKAQRKFFHETYNGGHHEKETNEAFHHGMDTVFNGMDELIPPMMKAWQDDSFLPSRRKSDSGGEPRGRNRSAP